MILVLKYALLFWTCFELQTEIRSLHTCNIPCVKVGPSGNKVCFGELMFARP